MPVKMHHVNKPGPTTIIAVSALLIPLCLAGREPQGTAIQGLRADFISNLGNTPVFSWTLLDSGEQVKQAGDQLLVCDQENVTDSSKGFLWISEKRDSSSSHQLVYTGPALESGRRYFARIKAWDQQDRATAWSDPTSFTVPLDYRED